MKQLQHVIWSKGVFLTPQHLQIQDQYVEDLLQFQLESCGAHLWGFAHLGIDSRKLADGLFSVATARGILPDGLLFDFPAADVAPPSRAIGDFFADDRRHIDVFLSVPEQRSNGINTGLRQDTKARFISEMRMVRDDNTGTSDKPIQIARKNLKLLLEGENQEGSTLVQIARVLKTTAGTFELDLDFIPPLLDIQGNDSLRRLLRGLVETLAARSSALAANRRQKNQSLADFTASDIANFWLQYTINQNLPVFRHLLERATVHPEQLFSAMLALAGALTTFSTTIVPGDLPQYQHEQLGKCFRDLERKIRILLETVIPVNFVAIPLKLVQPSIYAAAIEQEKYLRECLWYLAVSASVDDATLAARAPALIKVGATAHVEQMIRQALPGLKLMYTSAPPAEIPVKLKYKYFSLDLAGKVWEGIQRGRNVGVYVPLELPNPELELIVVLPRDR
jgi:type VI secretion system protein ImpJ